MTLQVGVDYSTIIYSDSQVRTTPVKRIFVLPDHTQLPDKDGTFVKNFQEHPQSILLTDSIWSTLQHIHKDGQFAIGQDCGIYWRLSDPPEKGAEAPDWFYVPNVPPMLEGQVRRSYVMWQEHVVPLIALEFVSGGGSEERDRTPKKGKFWVYEQAIKIPYYGIYEVKKSQVEMYRLTNGVYKQMLANKRGHYEIPELGVELGIWKGNYKNLNLPWLRWWDKNGNLLPHAEESQALIQYQIEQERLAKKSALRQMEQERQKKERLAAKLRELGIDPNEI
jgi:Uma2 family endonuclease